MPTPVTVHPIRTEADLDVALARFEAVMHAPLGTPEADEAEVLGTLIEAYEDRHYPLGPASPTDAILLRMEQRGLQTADLAPYLRSPERASEVILGKRSLTLPMIRRLHEGLGIPLRSLVGKS